MDDPYTPVNLSNPKFYLEQMRSAIYLCDSDQPKKIATPLFSFFSGKIIEEHSAELNAGHINILFTPEIRKAPKLVVRWTESIYYYFRAMAATPRLATELWKVLWEYLEALDSRGIDTLPALVQMASWANFHDQNLKDISLGYIKKMNCASQEQTIIKALFLSTAINEGNDDFETNITYAYHHSSLLIPIQRLQANINFYCQIEPSRKILNNIMSIINWDDPKSRGQPASLKSN
ncbi:MAG: hypothetical protein COB23_06430 [Methylophaga sp.]|nr:MAG: hypothetical protein COB23_06430 [Methylophaga sp.]